LAIVSTTKIQKKLVFFIRKGGFIEHIIGKGVYLLDKQGKWKWTGKNYQKVFFEKLLPFARLIRLISMSTKQ
jgi:hypothetical protein